MNKEKELERLFERFRNKLCSPAEERLLKDAIRSGEHQVLFERLIDSSLHDNRRLDDADEQRLKQVLDEVFKAVQQTKNAANDQTVYANRAWNFRRWLRTVAATLLLLGIGYFLWQKFAAQIPIKTVRVAYGQKKQLVLPDGSTVWLNSGTSFSYPQRFRGNQRLVNLENGQAYFDISRKPGQTFVVKARGMDVRVLGTSFEVKSFNGQNEASVSVGKGEVSVKLTGKQASRPILPRQQIVFDQQAGSLKRLAIDADAIAAWRENRLAFNNERLQDVLAALERQYNMPIKLANKNLAGQRVTLQLGQDSLQEVLTALSFTVNFKFKRYEKEIIIE